MHYTHLKRVVVLGIIAYFCVSVTIEVIDRAEMYPFFSWRLFAVVPNEVDTYTIEISRLGNLVYDPALRLMDAQFLFANNKQQQTEYELLINNLGRALTRNSPRQDTAQLHQRIEALFPPGAFAYAVVRVTYDSLEYWHDRSYQSRDVIETFSGTRGN